MERVIDKTTEKELYAKFEFVAGILNMNAIQKETGTRFEVGVTYLDYGQDWKWTTILAENKNRTWSDGWQVLCPRDWEKIVNAESVEDLWLAARDIMHDKYFIA